jgi:hypothetical protein
LAVWEADGMIMVSEYIDDVDDETRKE